MSWTAPSSNGASITDYDVQYRACTATPKTCASNPTWESSWTEHAPNTTSTAITATVTGLTNGTAYQVQVRATNSVGVSAWSASAKGLGVSWTAPASNGSSITDYDVQYRACTATPKTCASSPTWGSWTDHTHDGTGTGTTISGLTNGTAYQVQVQATNGVGDSAWSASAQDGEERESGGVLDSTCVERLVDHRL